MTASISLSKESASNINNKTFIDDVTHSTTKNVRQKHLDSLPSQTSTTSIGCRAITCAGKVLLGVFTVPTMAVLTALFGFVSGIANCFHDLSDCYQANKVCVIILSLTLALPVSIIFGVVYSTVGLFVGLQRGATIAYELSLDPLKLTWIKTKDALSFQP